MLMIGTSRRAAPRADACLLQVVRGGDDNTPEGRRCIDAVWQVLSDSGKPMERGEIIKWVNELVTTG
jgi:hypothetical protein